MLYFNVNSLYILCVCVKSINTVTYVYDSLKIQERIKRITKKNLKILHLEPFVFIVNIMSLCARKCIRPSQCLSNPLCFVPLFWPFSSSFTLPCAILSGQSFSKSLAVAVAFVLAKQYLILW